MSSQPLSVSTDPRVAVLVDCDNMAPECLEYALRVAAQFGRVVLRRGYGNQGTLGRRWQDALVSLAFTPCLQYQYASGKNTSDIALALEALEAMFERRADRFCLVTSDSDFAYLCRKLREHGAVVYIVGEAKTPNALRNASDQFFEWVPAVPQEPAANSEAKPVPVATPKAESKKIAPKKAAARGDSTKGEPAKEDPSKPSAKRRPRFVVDAVELLAGGTSEGKVDVATVGHYLKRTDPAFSPQTYGHSGLLSMLKSYDLLLTRQETGGHWSVGLKSNADADKSVVSAAEAS